MVELTALHPAPPPVTSPAGERLLDAAEQLFYWRGIGAVGVDLIADTAGVTKRTLYQRFGSKADLVGVYLQRRAHRWQSMLLAEVAATTPSAERSLVVYDVGATWAASNSRGCAFINAWAEVGNAAGPAADVIRQEKQWMRDLFRHLVDDPAVADHLHLLYEGALVTGSALGDSSAFAHARQAARRVLQSHERSAP